MNPMPDELPDGGMAQSVQRTGPRASFENWHRHTPANLGTEFLPIKVRQHFFAQKNLVPV